MKKPTSIKTRITIWYTSLMFVLVLVVLSLVGGLSYQLSIDSVEKDVILQVTQVRERLSKRQPGAFEIVESKEEFKNVSIYEMDGKYLVGQYNYDVVNIPFEEGIPRRESIDGKDYIVYDTRTPGPPGMRGGFWIRGVESINSTMLLGRSAIIIMLILIPLILLLTALGGYYITKKAFNPVNNIVKTANDISAQKDISKRIEIAPDSKEDELHHLSVTLNKMLDKIENLIKQEKQFTSDASHELRTPISVILAQGEYLLDISKDEKEKELAGIIVDKSKQVSKLVSRLLLLARIDQNRQKFNKEKVDLGVIVDVAVDSMKELAAQKGILIFSNVPEGTIVDADESLLLSAITNLISNGIKYGKESGHVSVSASKVGDRTEIVVADNGVGISEEHIDKIWTRFYRVDDVRNDEYGSNGLGLSMVKSIIELHGGEITVKSSLGHGTEFRIIL
ncbi:MAG: HAMP domain-containing histidine kinase [Clostridia bacterium]|nr:HAMP domain-containing histidine kinase [Clostridia bacterium]